MAVKGTTQETADAFTMRSKQARPATSGNKNISRGARRKTAEMQKSKVIGVFTQTHTGPYLGRKSI